MSQCKQHTCVKKCSASIITIDNFGLPYTSRVVFRIVQYFTPVEL